MALVVVAGCGGSPGPPAAPSHTVQLLVRDSNLREVGVDCSGSGPYLAFHRTAKFRVVDDAGDTMGEGTLPAGTSVPALKEDLEVDRVPTFCQFEFGVALPDGDAYQLAVDGRRDPIPLTSKGKDLVAVIP
ncbi:hypothetical protein [Tenggerimyces flavus]|uniref:Lipoprotein n=1 Tax=Tenggerimyces flavus TaxID=1708749 RepID=A0ABV7Y8S0_9ACTN|nr:hypothetical protein [Tenggerimyces flavus]MBM7791077.1 hypothetical protein [Tenggerimyces flavus]